MPSTHVDIAARVAVLRQFWRAYREPGEGFMAYSAALDNGSWELPDSQYDDDDDDDAPRLLGTPVNRISLALREALLNGDIAPYRPESAEHDLVPRPHRLTPKGVAECERLQRRGLLR